MDSLTIICLSVFEAVAIWIIVRLWIRKRRMSIVPRVFWSVILLIPVFGLMLYFFICSDGEKNPDHIETTIDKTLP
jgi:hypothetical protein